MRKKINDFIDKHVLPWPVALLTHRIVILITIFLMVPLIIWRDQTVFVLAVNSYVNVMAVAVSSIVLKFSITEESEHSKQDKQRDIAQYDLLMKVSQRLDRIEAALNIPKESEDGDV